MRLQVDLPAPKLESSGVIGTLFAEELGLLLEVDSAQESAVLSSYRDAGLPVSRIGTVSSQPSCEITVDGNPAVSGEAHLQHAAS